MRDNRWMTQFEGSTPSPVAVYRPGNGPLAAMLMSLGVGLGMGPAHFALGAVAQFEQEKTDLSVEEGAILALADSGNTLTQEQLDRLGAIGERLPRLEANLATLKAARERKRAEQPIDDQLEAAVVAAKGRSAEDRAPTPFKSLGEQLQAVAQSAQLVKSGRAADSRLLAINDWAQGQIKAVTGASEIVGADGGFLVQTDLQNDLLTDIFTEAVLAPLASDRQVGAGFNGVKFNVIDETSRATGSRYGAVRVYWTAEGGQKTASRPKVRQEEITLQKLAGLYVATDELLQDTVALNSFVRPAFLAEMAFAVDDAMFRGSGAGMPLGVLNSPALISVAKETGQDADSVVYENFVAMLGRLSPGSVRNAKWFMNQANWATLPLMSLVIGTGGVPVFLPPSGDAPFGILLGRPIEVIEQASAIGDVGDVVLADWKQYVLLRKGGIQEDTSIHVYFDTDETTFRWVLRINGRPIRQAPVTPYKGSATTSPFVTLAAR